MENNKITRKQLEELKETRGVALGLFPDNVCRWAYAHPFDLLVQNDDGEYVPNVEEEVWDNLSYRLRGDFDLNAYFSTKEGVTRAQLEELKANRWFALGRFDRAVHQWCAAHLKDIEILTPMRGFAYNPEIYTVYNACVYRLRQNFDIDAYFAESSSNTPTGEWVSLAVVYDKRLRDYFVEGLTEKGRLKDGHRCRLSKVPLGVFGGVQFKGQARNAWFMQISAGIDADGGVSATIGDGNAVAVPEKVRVLLAEDA